MDPSTSESTLPDIIDLTEEKSQRKSKPTNILPEKCKICQNPAVGFHYDVPSCNGCKAFFRRTVITGKLVKCKFENKCLEVKKETDSNRRLCGACRFSRCEEMGMNPNAIRAEIISEKGNILKKEIVKKREILSPLEATNPTLTDEFTTVITELTEIENKFKNLFNSNFPSNYCDLRPLSDIISDQSIFEISNFKNLSYLPNQIFPSHAGYAHLNFLAIVEFIKVLEFFPKIQEDSKLKIIRNTALMVRGIMTSNRSIRTFQSDTIRRNDGTIAGKPMRNYNGIWIEHRKIIQKSLHAFLRNKLDDLEFLLLKVMVICNPAIPGLPISDQKILETYRFGYAKCLLTYCFRQHGQKFGPDRFASLISIIPVLENQQMEEKSFNVILRSFYNDPVVLVSPLYDDIMMS